MDEYKEYLYELSKIQYKTPYVMVSWLYPPRLFKRYIAMIVNVPFEESIYHIYYGRVKRACSACMYCHYRCINNTEILVDNCKQSLSLDEVKQLVTKTVIIHDSYHQEVLKEFQPINSDKEKHQLDEIKSTYNNFKMKLASLRAYIFKLAHEKDVRKFTKLHMDTCITVLHDMGEYTRGFIARTVCSKIERLQMSISEIHCRMMTNAKEYKTICENGLKALHNEMYETNKNILIARRAKFPDSRAICELENKLKTIKSNINDFVNEETSRRLESEVRYWSQLLEHFNETAIVVNKVKTALEKAKQAKEIHQLNKSDHDDTECSKIMDRFYDSYIKDLENKYNLACMPIITAFFCPGSDQMYYEDNIGLYFTDEFGHKNYVTDYGARRFHILCDGQLKENCEDEKYYLDQRGRYLIEDDKKIYQLAQCTPKCTINKQGLFERIAPCQCKSASCKHTEENCEAELYKLPEEIVPVAPKPVDIKNTLTANEVNYLCENICYILPDVLSEIDSVTHNPIQKIAHLLLTKKNDMPPEEKWRKMKEAREYLEVIKDKRKKDAVAKDQELRKNIVKASKPEDLDMSATMFEAVAGSSKEVEYQLHELQSEV